MTITNLSLSGHFYRPLPFQVPSLTTPRHQERKKERKKRVAGVGKAVSRFRFLRLTHRAAKVEAILIQSKHGPRLRTSTVPRERPKLQSRPVFLVHKFPSPPDCGPGLHFHSLTAPPPKNLHHFLLLHLNLQHCPAPQHPPTPPNPGSSAAGSPAPASSISLPLVPPLVHFHTYLPTYLPTSTYHIPSPLLLSRNRICVDRSRPLFPIPPISLCT
ncbi:hypothetical protein GE21DRAFT_1113095 [Neurospora crassa]|nr:hypothetical protein GE21DRAFT_1113095 [Neurospora crassa]